MNTFPVFVGQVSVPFNQGHDSHTRFESGEAKSQFGKQQQRYKYDHPCAAIDAGMLKHKLLPFRKVVRVSKKLVNPNSDHDHVEGEICKCQDYGQSDRFLETAEED